MDERFNQDARTAATLATEEARKLAHVYVGSEHLLLGVLGEERGVGGHVLRSMEMDLERARRHVQQLVGAGQETGEGTTRPFTPNAKKVLELALRESMVLGDNRIGTEHVLLGIADLSEGVAARVLREWDIEGYALRERVFLAMSTRNTPAEERSFQSWGFEDWIRVGPGARVRGILQSAAVRALADGRSQIDFGDVLLAGALDPNGARLLVGLGVDEASLRQAVDRWRRPLALD